MEMPNVQVQTPSSQTSSASNTASNSTTSVANGEMKSDSFVAALIKVIEGQSTQAGEQNEVSADAGTSIVTAILPSSIVNLISTQPTAEEAKEMVQALIQVIESMNPEQLELLVGQPELQQWMASVMQLSNQQLNNSHITVSTQDVITTTVAQPLSLDTVSADDMITALNRYLEVAKDNPTHPIIQQLSSELKQITAKLSEIVQTVNIASNQNAVTNSVNPVIALVNPVTVEGNAVVTSSMNANASNEHTVAAIAATATTTVNATKSEGARLDKTAATSFLNIQLAQRSDQGQSSGDTLNQQQSKGSQSQLLQRLAYINPNVTVDATTTNDASTSVVVTSNVESSETLITLSQASELPKLSAMSSEAKVPMPTVSAQAFAEEMSRFIVKNMSITQFIGNGGSEAKISLVPEHLGQVDVKISVINGQITAHFMAESAHARDLLELQLPQLRASLQQQGLQVDKLNVEQQSNLASSMFQEQRHQQPSQQFTQNGKKSTKDYDQFGADFTVEMDQAVRVSRLAYGNTFNATA